MTGTPSAKLFFKGIEGEHWGELYDAYKEMSRAVGVKKPQEAQKAKALWKNEGSQGCRRRILRFTREDNILGRNKTRLAFGEEHLRDPTVALDTALTCVENSYQGSRPECTVEGCLEMAGVGFLQRLWGKKPIWEGVWLHVDPMNSVCLRTTSMEWTVLAIS